MITVPCPCGETYHAEDAHAGRSIRCRRCGRTLTVPPPTKTPAAGRSKGGAGGLARAIRSLRARERAKASRVARPTGAAGLRNAFASARRWTLTGRAGRLRRWTSILAVACLAGAVLAALLLRGLGDASWPATAFLFSGRWVLLLPLALLVPAALVLLNARALLTLAAAALVVLFPVMGLELHAPPSDDDVVHTPGHLRIVTLNADASPRVAYDLPALLEVWEPNVVALQECTGPVPLSVEATRGWYHQVGDGDLCLLSRFPIVTAQAMDRSALADVRAASQIGGAGFVVRYTLRLPSGPLRVTNLHLETPRKGFEALMRGSIRGLEGNTELRGIEARLAARFAAGDGGSGIVLGDFNTPPESRIYRSAWGSLTNAFSAIGLGFGYTRYNGWIRARIDHVLLAPGWRALRATVGDDVGSDHRPLIVDVAPER